tara:strand:- start:896 stop:2014 length:1119 start_codon:yes stop_codon:yes gene_type:complete
MKSYKIINIFAGSILIILMVLIFDLLINIVMPENFKKKIGTTRNYSLKSIKFHHKVASNIDLYEFWGNKKYKVVTNKYSMRVLSKNKRKINNSKKNIGFIGDSFVYGSGIDYENHFINILDKQNNDYNFLNLGYVSYSPSIYFKRLKFLIETKKIKFNKIFIFVDHSDVQDEGVFYKEDNNGNIVRKWLDENEIKQKNKNYKIKNYLKQNSFFFKIYDNLNSPSISGKAKSCIMEVSNKNYKNYIDNNRFGYGFNKDLINKDWVKEGKYKINYYLNKINELAKKNNFKIYIIYYPSALEVIENINYRSSEHYKMLKNFSESVNSEFIIIANNFFTNSIGKKNYLKNFIECDSHWNINGHKIVADAILNFVNE